MTAELTGYVIIALAIAVVGLTGLALHYDSPAAIMLAMALTLVGGVVIGHGLAKGKRQ